MYIYIYILDVYIYIYIIYNYAYIYIYNHIILFSIYIHLSILYIRETSTISCDYLVFPCLPPVVHNGSPAGPSPGPVWVVVGSAPRLRRRAAPGHLRNGQLIAMRHTISMVYHLVMTNSLPWKDPPFLRTVNHLFLWAIYAMAMLNNQMLVWKL